MPSRVSLWLDVHHGQQFGPSGGLWTREWSISHAPDRGDTICLWPGEDGDPFEGPTWHVKRRTWGSDGSIICELSTMIIDPDDMTQQGMRGPGDYYNASWWTDRDGDPIPELARGGWVLYNAR